MKVDLVLTCFDYLNYKKVKMITYEFIGYALVWRNQFFKEIRERRRWHENTWADLKRELRSRFVLASYARDLYNKLRHMYQGSESMEKYHKDIEVTLTKANMLESNEATMTRFLQGLNRDIQDKVDLYHYATMDDLVHQATRKRRPTSKKTYPSGTNNWRGKEEENERPIKDKSREKGSSIPQGRKDERMLPSLAPASKSNNIKCFKCLGKAHIASQCLNKRRMIMQEDGTIDSDSSITKSSSISNLDASSEYSPNDEGGLLMVRSLMSAQVGEDDES
ncbi:hypothetical protein CR513_01771, partial [Mucuna pruriens]